MTYTNDYLRKLQNGIEAEVMRSEGSAEHIAEIISVHVTVLAQLLVSLANDQKSYNNMMKRAHLTLDLAGERFMKLAEDRKNAEKH